MTSMLWIGIGAIIEKDDRLYPDLKKINDFLTKEMSGGFGYSDALRPHVNFYDLSVGAGSVEAIKNALADALVGQKPIACKMVGVRAFKFGIIYAEVERSTELVELHQKILKAVSQHRGDVIDPDYEKLISVLSEAQNKSLSEFGNPYMTEFKPHISLGYLPDKKDSLDTIVAQLEPMLTARDFIINQVELVKGKTSDAIEIVLECKFV